MKLRAVVQFRGDKLAFVSAWNSGAARKIELGVITLEPDSVEYQTLRATYDEYARTHRMVWAERRLVDYDADELRSYEILELRVNRSAGPGGNAYAIAYAEDITCSICGRRTLRQVSDLTVQLRDFLDSDLVDGDKFADLHITDNAEIILSDRIRPVLEQWQSRDLSFRPLHTLDESSASPKYWQLVVDATIGPALDPSPVERNAICKNCQRPREVLFTLLPGALGSEFYFSRASLQDASIFRTRDEFGRGPIYQPIYFISQTLYRSLDAARATGFTVQPAHLRD